MAHKVWAVGEEVLAADFQSYVQNQVVPQFANAAARATWAAPPKGALCVTVDTATPIVWRYNGAAWVALNPDVLAGGFASQVASGAAGVSNVAVAFGATFAAAPVVVGSIFTANTTMDLVHQIQTITTSGFTFRVITKGGTTIGATTPFTFDWLAVGTLI